MLPFLSIATKSRPCRIVKSTIVLPTEKNNVDGYLHTKMTNKYIL